MIAQNNNFVSMELELKINIDLQFFISSMEPSE